MRIKLTAILMMVSFLISCGSVTQKPFLPLPPQPIYPKISLEEVSCLPKSVKIKIKKRDKLKTEHILTLENIIKSTHK